MAALSTLVAYHDQRYRQLDDPEISDADFDLLARELRDLEEQHPELAGDSAAGQRSARRRAPCSPRSCTPCR